MKANRNFSDTNLERLHSLSISCVMSPSFAADLGSPLSVGMRVSVLQPFWIAMIIFCWKVKLLKLPSVTLANICGTNSNNRRAKGQPGVGIGVVKIFCDSDSSGSKSFRLFDSDSTALATVGFAASWSLNVKNCYVFLFFVHDARGTWAMGPFSVLLKWVKNISSKFFLI